MRVLVADDDAAVRRLLAGILASLGHEVVEAGDGEEAWRVLSTPDAPSVAILDWQMPGIDGLELCRRVRARDGVPYLYVALLSAAAEESDVAAGLAAGADDYVTKPFDAAGLAARLRFAERTLGLHRRLEARVRELESLARRHELLVDVLAKEPTPCAGRPAGAGSLPPRPGLPIPSPRALAPGPGPSGDSSRGAGSIIHPSAAGHAPSRAQACGSPSPGADPRGLARARPQSRRAPPLEKIPGGGRLAETFRTCLVRLGLCPVSVEEPRSSTDGLALDYCVWFPIVLRAPWRSLDFVLSASQTAAAELTRALTGRNPESRDQIVEALEESANLLRALVRSALDAEPSGCAAPVAPRGGLLPPKFSEALGGGDRVVLWARAGQVELGLIVSASRARVRRKPAGSLAVGEVLVEPLTSPRNPNLILLNTETALTHHYLEKIQELAADEPTPAPVAVLEPSPLGREMLAL